jgi:hypothetical protein
MSKNLLNEELNTMKYLLGYKRGVVISEQANVNETDEFTPQETEGITIDQIQGELDKEGVDVQASELVDTDNPTCIPTTDSEEHNGIISRIWNWANNPANRGSLKQTISSLKNAIFKAKEQDTESEVKEQVGTAALITIGGVALTPSLLIAIGGILLFILIVILITGNKKGGSPMCKRRKRLVRKHGMDGNFM